LRFLDRSLATGARIAAAVKREVETEQQHHIAAVRYVGEARGFAVRLGTGKTYVLPLSDLPEADRTPVVSAEMGEDDSYFVVKQASGNWFEVPWDDVLYHCEPTYSYYRHVAGPSEEGDPHIGVRLRELRKRKGLTVTELARRAEMKRPNLSRIEHGKHRPSLETLERLSEALGVPVAELVRTP
jgi:DNA-binding XRE family transcriptional regulator